MAEEAGAGNNQAAAGSIGIETAAPASGAKKTKTVRVKQEYIDRLLARRPRSPYPFMSEETIRTLIPENQEKIRAIQARIAEYIKVTREEEEDIKVTREEYRAKGFAEEEVEVSDDDVDGEGIDDDVAN